MNDSKGISYFFLGLGIGVAVGMIFAPQAGNETRGQIRDKALEGSDYMRRRSVELKENANAVVDKGKELLGRQREQFASALDAGRQAYREALGKGGSDIDDAAQGI